MVFCSHWWFLKKSRNKNSFPQTKFSPQVSIIRKLHWTNARGESHSERGSVVWLEMTFILYKQIWLMIELLQSLKVPLNHQIQRKSTQIPQNSILADNFPEFDKKVLKVEISWNYYSSIIYSSTIYPHPSDCAIELLPPIQVDGWVNSCDLWPSGFQSNVPSPFCM